MSANAKSKAPSPSLNSLGTWALFGAIYCKGSWGDLSSETVMDIRGYRNRNCTNFLICFYPKIKKVIAVNALPMVVLDDIQRHRHPQINYHVMDIEKRSSVIRWANSMTKVVSSNYFHYCEEQEKAFRNLFYILKPGGEAALLFNLQSGNYEWFLELSSHPRWKQYYDGASIFIPESHFKEYRAEHYEKLLSRIGFVVLYCQDEPMFYCYSTDESCKEGTVRSCPFADNIPKAFLEQFKEDSFQIFLKHNGRNSLGDPWLRYRSIRVILKKPL